MMPELNLRSSPGVGCEKMNGVSAPITTVSSPKLSRIIVAGGQNDRPAAGKALHHINLCWIELGQFIVKTE